MNIHNEIRHEAFWRGYIESEVKNMGKARLWFASEEQKDKKRRELEKKYGLETVGLTPTPMTTHNEWEKEVEEFKQRIGYTRIGSHPVLPTENSDVIVGAFMVGLSSHTTALQEKIRGMKKVNDVP